MNKSEFNEYFKDLSFIRNVASHLTDFVDDNRDSNIIYDVAIGLSALSTSMNVVEKELWWQKQEYSSDTINSIASDFEKLKVAIPQYNHFLDYRLMVLASEKLKSDRNRRLKIDYSMLKIADELSFLKTSEVENVRLSYDYLKNQWKPFRRDVLNRVRAKRDDFVFRIDDDKVIVCVKNSYDSDKKAIIIDSNNKLYNRYVELFNIVGAESVEVIRKEYNGITYACRHEVSTSSSDDLYKVIDGLTNNQLSVLNESVKEYGSFFRYYIR